MEQPAEPQVRARVNPKWAAIQRKALSRGGSPVGAAMLHSEVSVGYICSAEFSKNAEFDTVAFWEEYRMKASIMGFLKLVTQALEKFGRVRIEAKWCNEHHVQLFEGDTQIGLFGVEHGRRNNSGANLFKVQEQEFTVTATLRADIAERIHAELQSGIEVISNVGEVTWWYRGGGGRVQQHTLSLPIPKRSHDQFYPFIAEGLEAYYKRFLDSDENVLLLLGDPGTGKTSFLRWMLHTQRISTMVTYDDSILKEDEIFVNFLFGVNDLFIVEDADLMLSSRERDQNHIMSKFLNVSDGMIKFPNRKLVFTTNLTDLSRIDPALMRSGRCFDTLHFRKLTVAEGEAAAKVAGVEAPSKPVTLAELFCGQNTAVPKFGF